MNIFPVLRKKLEKLNKQISDILVLFIYMDFLEDYYYRLDSQCSAVKFFFNGNFKNLRNIVLLSHF